MSLDAINWVAKQKAGNATAKHVLLWLAFHSNGKSGKCFPSLDTLAEEMEVGSKNTIRAALKTLLDRKLISCEREMKGARVARTFYRLNFDGSNSDTSNIEGSKIDISNIEHDGSNSEPYGSNIELSMVQKLTPNKEIEQGINKEENKEVMCASSGAPYPEDFDQSLFDEAQREAQLAGSKPNTVKAEAPKHRTTTPRKKPATRCPFGPDASIPPEYLEIAQKAGIGDPQQVFSAFVNHAIAHDRSLVVWPAGFRTWCSNELRYHPNQTPKPKPLHQRTAADYDW